MIDVPSGETSLTAHSDEREVTISRSIDARPERAFEAYTDPVLVSEWWGPSAQTTVVDEVERLKRQDGSDTVIFGGAGLTKRFTDAGLVDEFRLTVDPVLLRDGTPLFDRLEADHDLTLVETKPYDTGTVLLHYRLADDDESNGGEGV